MPRPQKASPEPVAAPAPDEQDNGTAEKRRAFVDTLRQKCSVYHAAKSVGVGRSTVYRWRAEDAAFAAAWDDAIEDAVDELEASLYERAKSGKDTTAAIFLLKGRRKTVFGDKEQTRAPETGAPELPVAEQAARVVSLLNLVAQRTATN